MLLQAISQLSDVSPQTIDTCEEAGILTLGDLFEFVKNHSLMSIKDSTPLAVKELSAVVSKYESQVSGYQYDLFSSGYEDSVSEPSGLSQPELFMERIATPQVHASVRMAFEDTLKKQPNERANKIRRVFEDADEMLFTISREPQVTTMVDRQLGVEDNIGFWDFCNDALSAMVRALGEDKNTSLNSLIRKALDHINANLRRKKLEIVFSNLTPLQSAAVDAEYQSIYASLSSRAKNALTNLGMSIHEIIDFTFSDNASIYHVKNAGVTTFNEIRQRFLPLVDTVIDVVKRPVRELQHSQLSQSFPFLTHEQVEWVADARERMGHLPLFYLIYQYLTTSKDRADRIYALTYGFGGDVKPRAKIAEKMGVSLERVRQILVSYRIPEIVHRHISSGLSEYLLFNCDIVSPQMIREAVIESEFGTDQSLSDTCLLGMIKLMFEGEVVYSNDNYYFVSAELIQAFDFKMALKNLDEIVSARRPATRCYTLRSLVDPYFIHPVTSAFTRICDVMSTIIEEAMCLKLVQEPCLILSQNSVIIEDEVFKILYEKGAPMKLKDIQEELIRKFPFKKFDKKESVRSYLIKSDRIITVGKTSTYALKHWSINTLTVRDQIFEILNSSDRPLSINEIREALDKKGMSRSWTNIYSTIFTDVKRGYARYNNSYFGIATKNYDSSYEQMPMKVNQ